MEGSVSEEDSAEPSTSTDNDSIDKGVALPMTETDDDEDIGVTATSLHELYRHCIRPHAMYSETCEIINRVPINFIDDTGCTPLSILILHVNRGLRYHQYRLPQLAKLEDSNAHRRDIQQTCAELDAIYQEDVHKCLRVLLDHHANPNITPTTVPAIPYDMEWSENYEHKLMQSDQRWNLFSCGGSMEFTTYSIFNSVTRHRPPHQKGISILHLSAWRGDAECLELLLRHGANVHAMTMDNRNALHFLYLYCNKPRDLVRCTQLLVQYGIDVNLVDLKNQSPVQLLLNHYLVKRSHVKYLANSYTTTNICDKPSISDHYQEEIKQCIEILLEAGINLCTWGEDPVKGTPLHHLYTRLEHSLRNCEPEFQETGHYLVPYHYKLDPVINFTKFLLKLGSQVNVVDHMGRSAIHCLAQALRNLSLSPALNSNDCLQRCFSILLAEGADLTLRDYRGRTVIHYLIETICSTRHALPRYIHILQMLIACGARLDTCDHHGNTVLHLALSSSLRAQHLHDLLVFLLKHGADPNQSNADNKYPLNNLMREHINHHDPLSHGSVTLCLKHYLRTMDVLCRGMNQPLLSYIFSIYRESGFWGVICEQECQVYQLLSSHASQVRSLKDSCRLSIWKCMGQRFGLGVASLPLPTAIQQYLLELY